MSLVFDLPAFPSAAIAGSDQRFPVGRIFCVGRNYAAHAREMGSDPDREPPFFFTKFAQALVPGGGSIPYPPMTANYHYEAELVIAIGKEGAALAPAKALEIVYGYATGLDMTRRDLQFEARDKGRPWDTGKNFAFSAPLGTIRPVEGHGHVDKGPIRLTVNGEVRQQADLTDLIWSSAEIITHLSRYERLLPGDLIYTGTPAGVGPVEPTDVVEVTIEGLEPIKVTIREPEPGFKA
jgi:fumarylpyruvate hydrolase